MVAYMIIPTQLDTTLVLRYKRGSQQSAVSSQQVSGRQAAVSWRLPPGNRQFRNVEDRDRQITQSPDASIPQ